MKNNSHINFLSQNVTALFQHVSLVFQATKINYQLMQSKLFDNKLFLMPSTCNLLCITWQLQLTDERFSF